MLVLVSIQIVLSTEIPLDGGQRRFFCLNSLYVHCGASCPQSVTPMGPIVPTYKHLANACQFEVLTIELKKVHWY